MGSWTIEPDSCFLGRPSILFGNELPGWFLVVGETWWDRSWPSLRAKKQGLSRFIKRGRVVFGVV